MHIKIHALQMLIKTLKQQIVVGVVKTWFLFNLILGFWYEYAMLKTKKHNN